jgi:hypothetical protein
VNDHWIITEAEPQKRAIPITAFSNLTGGLDPNRRHDREAGLDARQLDLLVR